MLLNALKRKMNIQCIRSDLTNDSETCHLTKYLEKSQWIMQVGGENEMTGITWRAEAIIKDFPADKSEKYEYFYGDSYFEIYLDWSYHT